MVVLGGGCIILSPVPPEPRNLENPVFVFFSLLLSSLELSDTQVYEPEIRARLGTAAHFCEPVFCLAVTVLLSREVFFIWP